VSGLSSFDSQHDNEPWSSKTFRQQQLATWLADDRSDELTVQRLFASLECSKVTSSESDSRSVSEEFPQLYGTRQIQ
jgi:hypothetical protein